MPFSDFLMAKPCLIDFKAQKSITFPMLPSIFRRNSAHPDRIMQAEGRSMNVYDFDNTLLRGDSTARFFAYCLGHYPRMWTDIPGQA